MMATKVAHHNYQMRQCTATFARQYITKYTNLAKDDIAMAKWHNLVQTVRACELKITCRMHYMRNVVLSNRLRLMNAALSASWSEDGGHHAELTEEANNTRHAEFPSLLDWELRKELMELKVVFESVEP